MFPNHVWKWRTETSTSFSFFFGRRARVHFPRIFDIFRQSSGAATDWLVFAVARVVAVYFYAPFLHRRDDPPNSRKTDASRVFPRQEFIRRTGRGTVSVSRSMLLCLESSDLLFFFPGESFFDARRCLFIAWRFSSLETSETCSSLNIASDPAANSNVVSVESGCHGTFSRGGRRDGGDATSLEVPAFKSTTAMTYRWLENERRCAAERLQSGSASSEASSAFFFFFFCFPPPNNSRPTRGIVGSATVAGAGKRIARADRR